MTVFFSYLYMGYGLDSITKLLLFCHFSDLLESFH